MKAAIATVLCLFLLSPLIARAQSGTTFVSERVTNLDATGEKNVFFDLDSASVVDSSSTEWDVWFSGPRINVNGGLAILERKYESVISAPASDIITDESGITPFPSGSDVGWFIYDATTHTVEAVPQRTFVVKNKDGNYAKLQIISYYRDGTPADTPGAEPRFYSFRYTLRTDGSVKLK